MDRAELDRGFRDIREYLFRGIEEELGQKAHIPSYFVPKPESCTSTMYAFIFGDTEYCIKATILTRMQNMVVQTYKKLEPCEGVNSFTPISELSLTFSCSGSFNVKLAGNPRPEPSDVAVPKYMKAFWEYLGNSEETLFNEQNT